MDISLNLTPQTFMMAFAVAAIVEAIKHLFAINDKPAAKRLQPWLSMIIGIALVRASSLPTETVLWGKVITDGVVISAISMVTYDVVMGSLKAAKLKLPTKAKTDD